MQKCRFLLFFLVTLALITSCTKKKLLIGTWEFVEISDEKGSEDYNYINFRSFITFSSDNTFLFVDRGNFDPINATDFIKDSVKTIDGRIYYGIWSLKDSILIFDIKNYKMKEKFTAKIFSNDGKNLNISFSKQRPLGHDNVNSRFKYKKIDYDDVAKSKNNFTSQELNKWRQKSQKKESKKEIKDKVVNALEFAINFLEFHQQGNNKTAKTYYLQPLPFQFYSNGIVLKSQSKSDDWNNLFYNEEDADIAYSLLESGFDNVAKIPDNLSKKPLKINIFILQETLKNIRESN